MQKRVRPWLIVLAVGVIATASIVGRLDRIITVSKVLITKDYTIEETPYKDAITCTKDGTLLGSFKNSYTEENYIYLSGLEKSVYIPIESKHLGNESYAQRGSWYYLLLKDEKDKIVPSADYEVEYFFVKLFGETGKMEIIDKIYTTGIPWIIDTGTDTLIVSYIVEDGSYAYMKKYSIKNDQMLGAPEETEVCYRKTVALNEKQFVCRYNKYIDFKASDVKYKSYLGWADTDGNIEDSYYLGKYYIENITVDGIKLYVLLTHRNTTKSKLLTADLDFENEKFKNIQIYRLPKIFDAKFTTYGDMTYDAEKQRLNFMVRGPFAWDWSSSFLGAAYIDLKEGKVVPEVQAEIITNLNRSFYPECTYIGDDTTFYFSNLKGELLYMKASN